MFAHLNESIHLITPSDTSSKEDEYMLCTPAVMADPARILANAALPSPKSGGIHASIATDAPKGLYKVNLTEKDKFHAVIGLHDATDILLHSNTTCTETENPSNSLNHSSPALLSAEVATDSSIYEPEF